MAAATAASSVPAVVNPDEELPLYTVLVYIMYMMYVLWASLTYTVLHVRGTETWIQRYGIETL